MAQNDATKLPSAVRDLFDGPNFVTIVTLDPGGGPQTSLVWAKADGDDVLFSTIKGRRKYANLTRDSRIGALVFDPADPYVYAEVRGTATLTDDPAAELINELALKYTGAPFGDRPGEERVIVRIRPSKVVLYED
jgi:PPOX class probable F420-dependent enzyme